MAQFYFSLHFVSQWCIIQLTMLDYTTKSVKTKDHIDCASLSGAGEVWTYRRKWATCRSTEPEHQGRFHSEWQWSREACSLGYTRTSPMRPRRSCCQCVCRNEALEQSCTVWHWSLVRLWQECTTETCKLREFHLIQECFSFLFTMKWHWLWLNALEVK